MKKGGKPTYKIAKYDKAKGCGCECACTDPVSITVAVTSKVKTPNDLATLKVEKPDITIISD